jgi:hypothetical protein
MSEYKPQSSRIGEFARTYGKSVERVRQLDNLFKPRKNFGQREYGAKQHRMAVALGWVNEAQRAK